MTPGDFDVSALYDALDDERRARGITWTQLTRELNALFADVTAARPIATSTVTGMREKGGLNGNGIIQMLIWLDRTPDGMTSPASIKLLGRSYGIGFPYGMRFFRWMAQPAGDFTIAVPW